MMKNLITQSENISHEYCCTVVRLGEILEIEGAKTVAKTIVNGRTIVVSKSAKEGDLMFYCSNQSQINEDFLSVNNLYNDYTRNANYNEIAEWLKLNKTATPDEISAYLKTKRGYFNKKSQVKMTKLAGELSMGFLFTVNELINWCPKAKEVDFEQFVGTDFDTVNGELFIKAYVPKQKQEPVRASRATKRNKKLAKFDRMVPGQFAFHYDTNLLERNIHRLNHDDTVAISVKLHGTSFIIGNVLVKKPKWKGLYEKIFLKLPKFLQFTNKEYDVIYSSRSVIKNSTINPKALTNDYYVEPGTGLNACFNYYYNVLKDFIPETITLYGEIIGYVTDSNSFIQSTPCKYDYRLKPGENQFMIYRVVKTMPDGTKTEYDIEDVIKFTKYIKENLEYAGKKEIADKIRVIDLLYHGKIKDLYPEIPLDNNWNKNLLEKMKTDKRLLNIEGDEPLCRLKVPREGIVLRIDNDVIPEAFKLKSLRFLQKEDKAMETQEYMCDSEMEERYGEQK